MVHCKDNEQIADNFVVHHGKTPEFAVTRANACFARTDPVIKEYGLLRARKLHDATFYADILKRLKMLLTVFLPSQCFKF